MTTRHELIEFIKANPGCNNTDVAKHFGLTNASASTRTGQLYKGGFVTRKGSNPNKRNMLPRKQPESKSWRVF